MKLILFDIDGTLLLTGGVGSLAFNLVFQEMFGVPEVWGDYDPHGKTDSVIIDDLSVFSLKRKLNENEKREVARRYLNYFEEHIHDAPRFRLMPGVPELLNELANRKDVLGIATGNYKKAAELKLKRAKLNHYFVCMGTGDDSHERLEMTRHALKRALRCAGNGIKPEEVILIGDALADIECAKALGLRSIAVATGTKSVEQLAQLKPDLVLENLLDREKIISFIDEI